MIRWLALCLILCAATFGLVYVLTDPMRFLAEQTPFTKTTEPQPPVNPPSPLPPSSGGGSSNPVVITYPDNALASLRAPQVISEAAILPIYKQEVPSERQGRLLFLARMIKPEDVSQVPPDKLFTADLRYIAINTNPLPSPVKPGEPQPTPLTPNFVPYKEGGPLESERVYVLTEKHSFRELAVGDHVEAGELLAVVNPILAVDELDIKKEKLRVAMAEIRTSAATKDEAYNRWTAMVRSNERVPGSFPKDDVNGARLTYERYVQEEIAKTAAYIQSQRELNASITQLKMHEIRAAISGVVKTIYKGKGDAVKELEPVLQIQDPKHLRVEGLMEVQQSGKVNVGDIVYVEPAIAESPKLILHGHLQEVTCVAVSKGEKPLILSGSEDRTVRVWNPESGEQKAKIEHKSAVRSLACTGDKAEANLALVGCADGSARLFELGAIKQVAELSRPHKSSVTCVAFSPNGLVCATGHEDHTICLWDTATGNLRDQITNAHKAPVTSVQFATDETLVSAGRDQVLNVWDFTKDKSPVRRPEFDKRSGDVTQLGVSPDGKYVLFDDGKDLRILSLETRQIVGSIQNSGAGFRAMAMFAPNGKTILTTNASENRLQLWRTPVLEKEAEGDAMARRASELRQFTWSSGKETSGAYAPDASFIVSGTQDHQVLVWGMPSQTQIDTKLPARVTLVEKSLDASSRQVRIWAELENPGWLIPGGNASIVIPPVAVKK